MQNLSLKQKKFQLDMFKQISDISKSLRLSIKHMPKYYRYDIGDEIRRLLRDMKYKAFLLQKNLEHRKELYCMSKHLEILIDECIEDNALLLTGKYTIALTRKGLTKLIEELNPA